MAYTRAQVREIEDPRALRPVRQAIDTYAAPEKPPIDNDAENLAKALSAFGASISAIARQEQKNDPREAEIYAIKASASDPQFIQMANDGRLPYQDVPHLRALTDAELGQRVARVALNNVQLGMKDGTLRVTDDDDRPVDVNTYIQQEAAKYGLRANSVPFMKAYATGIEAGRNSLVEFQRGRIAEINKGKINDLAKSSIDNIINAANAGANDNELRTAMLQMTADASRYGGMHPRDVDALWVGRLRQAAASNPDVAARLLTLDRGADLKGQPIGSIARNPTHKDSVTEIVREINTAKAKQFDTAKKEEAVEAAAKALRAGDGSFSAVTDLTYENPWSKHIPNTDPHKRITRSTIQDEALARYQTQSDEQLRREGTDPATDAAAASTQFERDYVAYTGANRANPRWQGVLTHAGRILSNPTELSQPDNQQKVVGAYELYKLLNTRNPGYLRQTLGLTEKDEKFYDQMQVYEMLGSPKVVAAQQAAKFVNTKAAPLSGSEMAEVRKEADRLDYSWWIGKGYNNSGTARRMVYDAAVAIAADRDISPKEAAKAAKQIVQDRAVVINGRLTPPHPVLNNENTTAIQTRLDEVFKDNAKVFESQGVGSARDFTVVPIDSERFRVIKSDGSPVVLPRLDPKTKKPVPGEFDYLHITASDIQRIKKIEEQKATERTVFEQENAADYAIVNAPKEVNPTPGKFVYPYKVGGNRESNLIPGPTKEERDAAWKRIQQRSAARAKKLYPDDKDRQADFLSSLGQ